MTLDVVIVLDRSGSMRDARADHEGGIRSFVQDQRELKEDDVRLTLIQFDTNNPFEIVHDRVPINEIDLEKIVLIPRGGTPLLDAVGKSFAWVEEQLKDSNVVVMVVTDGEENSSKEWTLDGVRQVVADAEKRNVSSLFLGANIDGFSAGMNLGFAAAQSVTFANNSAGVSGTYSTVSSKMTTVRNVMRSTGASFAEASVRNMSYTAHDRAASMGDVFTTTTGGTQDKDTTTP